MTTPQEIVSWDKIIFAHDNISSTEEAVILKCFKQHISGNDGYDDKSTPEMEHFYEVFKEGWIMHELFCKDVK